MLDELLRQKMPKSTIQRLLPPPPSPVREIQYKLPKLFVSLPTISIFYFLFWPGILFPLSMYFEEGHKRIFCCFCADKEIDFMMT